MFRKHIPHNFYQTERASELVHTWEVENRSFICHGEIQKTFVSNTRHSRDLYEHTDIKRYLSKCKSG